MRKRRDFARRVCGNRLLQGPEFRGQIASPCEYFLIIFFSFFLCWNWVNLNYGIDREVEVSGLTESIPVRSNQATNDWIPKSLRPETFKWVKYKIPRRWSTKFHEGELLIMNTWEANFAFIRSWDRWVAIVVSIKINLRWHKPRQMKDI